MLPNRFATARNLPTAAAIAAVAVPVAPAPFVLLAPSQMQSMQQMATIGGWPAVWPAAALYQEAHRRAQAIVLARQASARLGRTVVFATARNRR